MVLSLRCTKNLVERIIEAQKQRGYTIKQKTRRKPVLPVSTKPLQPQQNKTRRKPLLPVSTKPLHPQQNETAVQDPTNQK